MGKHLNVIIAIIILVIVTAVCSNYFYRKGQESAWKVAQQLMPLAKGEIYLCVEKSDDNGVKFLTVQKVSQATRDRSLDQGELQFRLSLARDGLSLEEYNRKYRNSK